MRGTSRREGIVTGRMGAVAGLLAMRYYWQRVAPEVERQYGPDTGGPGANVYPDFLALDRPYYFGGRRYRDGASATDALGRLLYANISGRALPSEETKQPLR